MQNFQNMMILPIHFTWTASRDIQRQLPQCMHLLSRDVYRKIQDNGHYLFCSSQDRNSTPFAACEGFELSLSLPSYLYPTAKANMFCIHKSLYMFNCAMLEWTRGKSLLYLISCNNKSDGRWTRRTTKELSAVPWFGVTYTAVFGLEHLPCRRSVCHGQIGLAQ